MIVTMIIEVVIIDIISMAFWIFATAGESFEEITENNMGNKW